MPTLGAYCLLPELKGNYKVQTIQLIMNNKQTVIPQSGHEPFNAGIYTFNTIAPHKVRMNQKYGSPSSPMQDELIGIQLSFASGL
jgi:hypothetical protein